MKQKRFWMVNNSVGANLGSLHETSEGARREAMRLAGIQGNDQVFVVLETVDAYQPVQSLEITHEDE